jgi:hypothetical protein
MRVLDDYEGRFSSGVLAPEARALRIETLAQLHDQVRARQLADTFLKAHPNSPLAERVRKIEVGGSNP